MATVKPTGNWLEFMVFLIFYRRWGLAVNSSELLSLEEDIFQYAKKNLAVVNVYIKGRDFFAHTY